MKEQQRNMILAFVLSAIVLFGYPYFFGKKPAPQAVPPAGQAALNTQAAPTSTNTVPANPVAPAAQAAPQTEVLADAPRIAIETPSLNGSISLAGGRIDDLVLTGYYENTDRARRVKLLSPAGTPEPYYVEQGWIADDPAVPVPTAKTVWTAAANRTLTPDAPLTLTWDNGAGLLFERTVAVDANYLFTVTQKVTNQGGAPVTLRPYSTIVRLNPPPPAQSFGPSPSIAGVYDRGLDEVSYKDLAEKGTIAHPAVTGGWVGLNDKYWLVATVPQPEETVAVTLRDAKSGDSNRYSADYQAAPRGIPPNSAATVTSQIFAGAKVISLLDTYRDTKGIAKLDRTVDFGSTYILAKPFFLALDYIAKLVGNFGVAILIFNVILKLILFPLQDKSFHQMARMRDLQPKIAALKEKYGDDRQKMATAQMELFKKEKINPASGCLPLLVQIPIFFALYRVLISTIEMRHAPFFGWIHDLSAADPTSVFNLFGLIPWTPPSFLMFGVWPILYGASLYLQQKMTPTPVSDPVQARIMMAMPLIMTLFLAHFPAGLMIYYSWNNVLTIGQMALINKRAIKRKEAAKT